MKNPWLSAILNFFFMGLGYIYNGKRVVTGILLTIAAIGLTYVEQFHTFADGNTLKGHDSKVFMIMFIAVFAANTGLAMDAYKEAKSMGSD